MFWRCKSKLWRFVKVWIVIYGRFVKVLRVSQRFEGLSKYQWFCKRLWLSVSKIWGFVKRLLFTDFRPSIGTLDEFDNCTNTGFYDAYPGWSLEFEIMQNHQQLCQWIIYNANPGGSFTLTLSDMEVSLTWNFKINFIRYFLDWILLWQILCQRWLWFYNGWNGYN